MKWGTSSDRSEELPRDCDLNEILYNLAKEKKKKSEVLSSRVLKFFSDKIFIDFI